VRENPYATQKYWKGSGSVLASASAIHAPMSETAPWYLPTADEVDVFEAAYAARLPVLLKGPTGCGKTRFVEHMAWRLSGQPLSTVACHEDLTATDLVGRYLLSGDETVWMDGPLTSAVRNGAICYLDEVVEARKDTTVTQIVATESGVDEDNAERLARIGEKTRHLRERGFEEGVSTRLLVYAGQLMAGGIAPRRACEVAVIHAVSDDPDAQQAVADIVDVIFP